MQNLGTARARLRGRQVPASGEAGSCQVLPMAGQDNPLLLGSKDIVPKVPLPFAFDTTRVWSHSLYSVGNCKSFPLFEKMASC